jgi:putative RNA 2'-phosphotransferase
MSTQLKHISKLMSLVLRHKPEKIDLQLDENGWADVQELIQQLNAAGIKITNTILEEIVASNDKQRFAFNTNKAKIRASQGHSIAVELDLTPVEPPDMLYHGTTTRFLESILANGLQKQNRRHVHLSATTDTATTVGSRHGKPVILTIHARSMHAAGFHFFLSENKVWLTNSVPIQYITQ